MVSVNDVNVLTTIWTEVPSNMWAKQRLKSECAFAQSDQSLRCLHEETLHPCPSKMRSVKILIRLCECAGWSESSLGAQVRRYVFRAMWLQKMILIPYANIEGPDQPAHPRSLIRTFYVHQYFLHWFYKPAGNNNSDQKKNGLLKRNG